MQEQATQSGSGLPQPPSEKNSSGPTAPHAKQPSDYHSLAAARGFQWLGPPVRDTSIKTAWQCSHGHTWQTAYNTIQQGSGCPVCSGHARKTEADYHALAKARNIRWIGSTLPPVTRIKTMWECPHGHRWKSSYHNVRCDKGCPACAGRAAKQARDYRSIGRARDIRWIGQVVPDHVGIKTRWACRHGHTWEATYNTIQQGHGCPWCANHVRKTPEDYQAVARARGFEWLGPEVSKVNMKTTWRCSRGHLWQTTYTRVRRGHGCPTCPHGPRKMPADYHALARRRGFEWLGPEAPTVRTKTWWRCSFGHEWFARYEILRMGYGCPVCNRSRGRK